MAETVVSFVLERLAESVLESLVPLVEGEVKLLRGVRGEVESIQKELMMMRAFLKDADRRAEKEERVKMWVNEVRDLAYTIENVLDDFEYHFAPRPYNRDGVIRTLCDKTIALPRKLIATHHIGSEIQDIKRKIGEVKGRMETYNFRSSCSDQGGSRDDTGHDPRVVSLFLEDSEIVGFDRPKQQLIGWLVEGELSLSVISVVGMGGLGKTTLVKKVYDSERVKSHFECFAWITVSQSYQITDLLKRMLSELYEAMKHMAPQGLEAMDEAQLMKTLKAYLQQKRNDHMGFFRSPELARC